VGGGEAGEGVTGEERPGLERGAFSKNGENPTAAFNHWGAEGPPGERGAE